jgi:hypothetical protein
VLRIALLFAVDEYLILALMLFSDSQSTCNLNCFIVHLLLLSERGVNVGAPGVCLFDSHVHNCLCLYFYS